uniref:DUF6682 family protein n=1 Tax=Desulfobacter sp. TaxID=2294 RepID=UPI003D10D6A6
MTYSANTVIPTIKKFIHDPDETIWSVGDLCKHVTEAQHLIASLRPDATATMVSHTVSMSPKQTLPVNGVRLLDVPMNTDGAPIR